MERFCGTVMAMVSPAMVLTKICMVSTASGDAEREFDVEERMLDSD